MADRLLSDAITEALHDDFDSTKYSTIATNAFNDALQEIARRVPLASQRQFVDIVTVPGQSNYDLPLGFSWLRGVVDTVTGQELEDMQSIDEYDARAWPAVSGIPTSYILDGHTSSVTQTQVLVLWPTPNVARTFRVRYQRTPSDLSSSNLVAAYVPDDFARVMIAYARSHMFALEDDQPMSDFWMARFEAGVAKLRGSLSRRGRAKRRVGDLRRVRAPAFRWP